MAVALMLLVGVPAAGKTKLSTMFVNRRISFESQVYTFVHINHDELMPHRDLNETSKNQWKQDRHDVMSRIAQSLQEIRTENSTRCLCALIHQPIVLNSNERLVIIIDDNMYYRSMRLSYYRLAQMHNCGFCQVYIETDLDTALAANENRSGDQKIPKTVIQNIFHKIEFPDKKNNWEKNSVGLKVVDDFKSFCEPVLQIIKQCLDCPESVKETLVTKPEIHPTNLSHDVDIVLRKFVSKLVIKAKSELVRDDVLCFTQDLMRSKWQLLADIKSKEIIVPLGTDLEEFIQAVLPNYCPSVQRFLTND